MYSETDEKKKHNRKRYRTYIFRVRRDSELEILLNNYGLEGATSVNYMMTEALCKYLDCPIPHREYSSYKRTRII
jgi:hypothetical protein